MFIINIVQFFNQMQITIANRFAAMIVYMMNLSFNHYENFYVLDHHRNIHSNYKSFNRRAFAKNLLKKHTTMWKKMNVQLNVCNHFNFFTNENVNIRKKRVINLCCHVFFIAIIFENEFHFKTNAKIVKTMTTQIQINWMTQKCKKKLQIINYWKLIYF